MRKILVMNGPNLNLLGERSPTMYGTKTLADIERMCQQTADDLGYEVVFFQSNHEGALIDCLQAHRHDVSGVVINPGGYGHSSVALRDALELIEAPIIEVHLTHLAKRESFRHFTLTAGAVTGVVSGIGAFGYRRIGILAIDELLSQENEE